MRLQRALKYSLDNTLKRDDEGAEEAFGVGENPFDSTFATWAEQLRPQIRQHLIGGADSEAKPRESQAARLHALHDRSDADQLQEARTIIQHLERCGPASSLPALMQRPEDKSCKV